MQLSLLEKEGFTLEKPFTRSGDGKFGKLESTFSILLNGTVVLYVQDNENGTYNTFGFGHGKFEVSLSEVIEIAKNKNNWCLRVN